MLSEISVVDVLENGHELHQGKLDCNWRWDYYTGIFNFIHLVKPDVMEYKVPIFSIKSYRVFIMTDYLVVLEKDGYGDVKIHSVLQNS